MIARPRCQNDTGVFTIDCWLFIELGALGGDLRADLRPLNTRE